MATKIDVEQVVPEVGQYSDDGYSHHYSSEDEKEELELKCKKDEDREREKREILKSKTLKQIDDIVLPLLLKQQVVECDPIKKVLEKKRVFNQKLGEWGRRFSKSKM